MYNSNADEAAIAARNNENACKLYGDYHFDSAVRESGAATEQVKLSAEIISLIGEMQERMLSDIERVNLCVECNPSSNLKIGRFSGYSSLPIIRMLTIRSSEK